MRELRALPVAVDDGRDLAVHECADAGLQCTLLVGEQRIQVIVVRVLRATQDGRLDNWARASVRSDDSVADRRVRC